MSELVPLSGVKLKSDFGAVWTAFDPYATSTLLPDGFRSTFRAHSPTRFFDDENFADWFWKQRHG